MPKFDLKISLVIPVYNEQKHIAACLRAISKLDVIPYEVIVIDNLSTDKTVEVVKKYSFVTLIKEDTQGVVFARDRGFNYASGDIIGRIDADTILPPDWTAKVIEIFKDDAVQAVSGGLHFYDIGMNKVIDKVDKYWRAWMAKRMAPNNRIFLFGANMAIRKSAWMDVRSQVCHQRGFHEDLDLALHLSDEQKKVIFDPDLKANVSARRIDCRLIDLALYAFINPWTYIKHNAKEHRYMYPLILLIIINFLFLKMLFRAFDNQAQRFNLKKLLFGQSAVRVNPADFM
jgi:glycosyltransferase involved in cell wall biosynthesis